MAKAIGLLLSTWTSLTAPSWPGDEDSVDRWNHLYVHGVLLTLSLVVGTHQLVGSPVNCWLPAQYKEKGWISYANHHCWVQSLYYVPGEHAIPLREQDRQVNPVSFYRWSSVVFLVLAAGFYLPHLVWKELRRVSGVNMGRLIAMASETALLSENDREQRLGQVAEFFHRWVASRVKPDKRYGRWELLRRSINKVLFFYNKRSGYSLVLMYFFVKILYLLNNIGQFLYISSFLRINFWTFGWNILQTQSLAGTWDPEALFPRVALCDMKVRQMVNFHTYSFQCVLTLNLFLEKMFVLLWFLLLLMLLANGYSLLLWVSRFLGSSRSAQFLLSHSLGVCPEIMVTRKKRRLFMDMVIDYLRPDGLLVIRMISLNAQPTLTVELFRKIWLRYQRFLVESSTRQGRRSSLL